MHCEGQVYSQAVWDLWNRDLVGAPFNLDLDVAREIATQLTYRGASNVSSWYACTNGTGGCGNPNGCGCAANSGYMSYIAADDDNGNLNDGTPHMGAIFAAFNRHGIACTTPTVTTAGCAGTPDGGAGRDRRPPSTAASRSPGPLRPGPPATGSTAAEGVFACSFGKELVATVAGTTYIDRGLKNGREYYYQVVPMGAQDECFSVASTCTNVTPAAGANVSVVAAQATLQILGGDGDDFLDNCEIGRVTVRMSNIGNGDADQPADRQRHLAQPSGDDLRHGLPGAGEPQPRLPAPRRPPPSTSSRRVSIPGEVVELEIEVTSDELGANSVFATASFSGVEGDLQHFAEQDLHLRGRYRGLDDDRRYLPARHGAAAAPVGRRPTWSRRASSTTAVRRRAVADPRSGGRLDDDAVQQLQHRAAFGHWWDRANIGLRPVGSPTRTLVSPSGGRLYNASGSGGGTCGTDGQGGWAGVNATWGSRPGRAAALQAADLRRPAGSARGALRHGLRRPTTSASASTS